ncbi:MAG: hypothetical protein FJX57_08065 [Alphaproteobacteria bacterium]|nr:hypothetical protein [Alphaproteobacteria bacterium]
MAGTLIVQRWGDGCAAALMDEHRLDDFVGAPGAGAMAAGAIHVARVDRSSADLGLTFVILDGGVPAALETASAMPVAGERLLVQVSAPAQDDKPVRVRRRVSLPGQLVVLHPGARQLKISRRAQRSMTSRAMIDAIHARAPAGCGLTLRSAAARAPEDAIIAELDRLTRLWRAIEARTSEAPCPSFLYADPPAWRASLPLLRAEPERLLVSERRLVREFAAFGVVASLADDVDLFGHAGVEEALAASAGPRVAIPGGGVLTIERTRALIAIDIDSAGGEAGSVNRRAIAEIARQLRLRDGLGTILVDFLRGPASQRRALDGAFADAVAIDRRAVDILGWTRGGLLELRRSMRADE